MEKFCLRVIIIERTHKVDKLDMVSYLQITVLLKNNRPQSFLESDVSTVKIDFRMRLFIKIYLCIALKFKTIMQHCII